MFENIENMINWRNKNFCIKKRKEIRINFHLKWALQMIENELKKSWDGKLNRNWMEIKMKALVKRKKNTNEISHNTANFS